MKKRVTMAMVAKAAGVHQTTVSLALRGDRRIPEPTRARIEEVARKLAYRPNPLVSALHATRNRRNMTTQFTLGYVTADSLEVGGPRTLRYSQDLFDGAKARADELGYGLEHFWLADPKLTKIRFNQITQTRNIHGLIIGPLFHFHNTLDIDWERFSVVAYGYFMAAPSVHRVQPDYFHAAMDLYARCRRAGFRRIGLALEKNSDLNADHLWRASILVDQQLHPYPRPTPILLLEEWREDEFMEWYLRVRPEVVTGTANHISRTAPWFKSRGIRVGQDVQLAAFGTNATGDFSDVAGVSFDRAYMGARAVDFLVAMMHRHEKGVPERTQHVFIQTSWHDAPSFVPRGAGAGQD